jgi:DNA (cytosine-5)-methyltransferase 1
MNFQNDVTEIVSFINSGLANSADSYENTLKKFTTETGEKYLDERAAYILDNIESDDELKRAFLRLEKYCQCVNECEKCVVKKYCNTFIKMVRHAADLDALQMVDLFCGAGGLSLGFSQEGFVTALANDIEECCVDTYAHNHPETPRDHIVLGDIRLVTDHLEELLQGKNVDIVVGGPPCQGFSMANRQRLIDDPRNHLYKSYVEIVKRVQPKFFVMENVKGMLSVASQVKEDFNSIGYEVEYHVLNAKDFGVPQNRERLIYIGNRMGVDNGKIFDDIFALSNSIPDHVLGDALYGLRPLEALRIKNATELDTKESGYKIEKNQTTDVNEYVDYINQGRECGITLNHKARYNNDRDIEIFGRMYQGDKSDDPKIADIMPYKRRNGIFKDKYFKLEENKVSKTITAHMKFDCNMYIHPTQARGLTPREAARIQSYPDDYYFRGAYTKTYMQIGNSVPPLLGRAIASCIKKYI